MAVFYRSATFMSYRRCLLPKLLEMFEDHEKLTVDSQILPKIIERHPMICEPYGQKID